MILTVTPNPCMDRTLEVAAFAPGGTFKGRLLAARFAGKGVNVARVLVSLGLDCAATGLLGGAELPAFEEDLKTSGIWPAFVAVQGELRTNFTMIDPESGMHTHIRETGPAVSKESIALLAGRVGELCAGSAARGLAVEWAVGSGSLPDGMTAADYAEVLSGARNSGVKTALDTSGEGLRTVEFFKPDLLKVNAEELEELARRALSTDGARVETARGLLEQGTGEVLLTLGEEGAILVTPEGALRGALEPEGETVSAVGAGDAALAGYIRAAVHNEGPEGRLTAALAAGSGSLAEPVAGALDSERFERLREKARVARL